MVECCAREHFRCLRKSVDSAILTKYFRAQKNKQLKLYGAIIRSVYVACATQTVKPEPEHVLKLIYFRRILLDVCWISIFYVDTTMSLCCTVYLSGKRFAREQKMQRSEMCAIKRSLYCQRILVGLGFLFLSA